MASERDGDTMIKCGKCGKVYDYERYNGICPVCARYNRKDSDAAQHKRLHEQYDRHTQVHKTEDLYRAPVYASKSEKKTSFVNTSGRKSKAKTSKNAVGKASVAGVFIAVIAGLISVAGGIYDEVKDSFPTGGIEENSDLNELDMPESTNDIDELGIEAAYSFYLGTDISRENLENFVEISDGDEEALQMISQEEGEVYYVITLQMDNYLGQDIRLQDCLFDFESDTTEEVTLLRTFDCSSPEIIDGEGGAVYFLVAVPENAGYVFCTCIFPEETGYVQSKATIGL